MKTKEYKNPEHYKNLSLDDIEEEEWRDIKGFEGSFQVSSMGRVKSLDRYITPKERKKYFVKGKIIQQTSDGGYMHIHFVFQFRKRHLSSSSW